LEPPANPAFTEDVPLSKTIGWLSKMELPPASPPDAAALSAALMLPGSQVLWCDEGHVGNDEDRGKYQLYSIPTRVRHLRRRNLKVLKK
jgi:hypothetical protein